MLRYNSQRIAARQIDSNSTFLVVLETEKENERVSIESCRGHIDRIGDWKHHPKEVVLLKSNKGGKRNEQDRNQQTMCRG